MTKRVEGRRFAEGQTVGRYHQLHCLGSGGWGETYSATDTLLGRTVALKCLKPEIADRSSKDLLRREACAQARVSHPNACYVFDVIEDDTVIVMEYVDGDTLEVLNGRSRFSREQVLNIGIDVADAVSQMHAEGVLHRDLKFENIMLTTAQVTKVLDFGLAALDYKPDNTRTENVFGTPGYASPEQLRPDGKMDYRTDVFTLGVVLYRLVTNQFPYTSPIQDQAAALLPPKFSDFGLPEWPELYKVLNKAVDPDPVKRYQTMAQMLDELRAVRVVLLRDKRTLCFFDTSTLLEVVWPHKSATRKQRTREARHQFEIHHTKGQAVTSASVLCELLDSVLELYFSQEDKDLPREAGTRRVLKHAKKEVLRQRQDAKLRGDSWQDLRPEDKMLYLGRVRGLFIELVESMTAQLAVVDSDISLQARAFVELAVDHGLSERDSRVLSQAYALRAKRVISEVPRYRHRSFKPVLSKVEFNEYSLKSLKGL